MKTCMFFLMSLFLAFPVYGSDEEEEPISTIITPKGGYDLQEENKKVIETFYSMVKEGNVFKINQIVSPRLNIIEWGEKYQNKNFKTMSSKLSERIQGMHNAFPGFSLDIVELIGEGNRVFARTILKGVQKGSFLGISPTHRQVTIRGFTLFTLTKGKITSMSTLWNELSVMKDLGYIVL